MGSIADSTDVEDWLDIGNDTGSVPSLTLDDVLNEVDNLDETLSFLDESDECSLILGGNSPLPPTSLTYTPDSAITTTRLESISHQLSTLVPKAGTSQAIAVHAGRLAVGTSKGMVIIFNGQGFPEHFLPGEDALGPAACLAFSPDGKNVSIGFSKGAVKVISVRTGTVHHFIREAVQPGRGVLQICYLDRSSTFLTLDSGGNVFEVRLKSNIVGRKNQQIRCVFSGCNGEVVRMKYLPNSLLALLTVSKVMLVSTRFGGAILCAFSLKTFLESPPLLDFSEDKSRPNQLKVCIVRGEKLSIFNVHLNRLATKQKAISLVRSIQLPFKAVVMQWIKQYGIVVVDATGDVLFVDAEKGIVRDCPTSQGLDLVFGTADYKGLATGGLVSAALSFLAENVCYSSVCRWAESIFLLTYNGLYVINTLTEEQQLQLFEERRDVVSSCLFLLDCIRGHVRTKSSFRAKAFSLLKASLLRLCTVTTDGCSAGKVADLMAHYRKYVSIILFVCVHSKMLNVFYDEIWPRLERDTLSRSAVLESLDEWVLDGALNEAPPTIVSAYLCHLAAEGHYSQMQAAIVRFPIQSIDLHHVMSTCRQNGLYDGIIYVMNKALGDYITPLEEMLDTVSSFASHDVMSDSEIEQGTRLLLYLHCCLAGQSYPFGTLPKELRAKVPVEVYRCITSLKGKHGSSSADRYPYLRLLLLFDAQQFVHVICTCVDAPVFQEEGRLQRLTEMIGLLATELRTVSVLLHFIRLVIQLVEEHHILAPTDMVEDAISCLLRISREDTRAEEGIVDAMRAMPQLNRKTILRLAHTPMRSKICSFIYLNDRRFVDLIKCYAADDKHLEIFTCIRDILVSDLSREETKEVTKYVRSMLPQLCAQSPSEAALLIIDFFIDYLSEMKSEKKDERKKQYGVLKECFRIRRNREESVLSGIDELDDFLMGTVVEEMISNSDDTQQLELDLQDLLSYWLPIGAKTDFCLNLAASAGCIGTMILLLEARGFSQRAFDELCEQIRLATDEQLLLSWLDRVLSFSSRHSIESNEKGWLLTVFNTVIQHSSQGLIKDVDSRLQTLVGRILSTGSQHSHQLVEALLELPSFREGTKSDYSDLISSILSACSFEKSILSELVKCVDAEMSTSLHNLARESSRRVATTFVSPMCIVCGRALDKAAYVFGCGHVIHMECDKGKRECICYKAKSGIAPKTGVRLSRIDHTSTTEAVRKRDIFENWNTPLNLCPH